MYSEIYLVDDEELTNMIHTMQFRKLGLEDRLRSFTNPELALDHLRFRDDKEKRVIVFLDINMPEMTGFEFVEFMFLERFPTSIDVVIVSSSISEEDYELSKKHTKYVRGYINKPLSIEHIKQFISNDKSAPKSHKHSKKTSA